MLFPTLNFLLFFLVVLAVAWLLRDRIEPRKWFLIAASYFFYANWDWRFCFLLFASSVINYTSGLWVGSRETTRGRNAALALGVAANLLVLGFFKYYNFFIESLDGLLHAVGWQRDLPFLEVILPVGVSFFTFQGISYVADVHRREISPCRSFTNIALLQSFFPHLVAGPIVRAASFLPQLDRKPDPSGIYVSLGVCLILWGLFKKSIVANYLAIDLVDKVFETPSRYGALDTLIATYGYAVQIYCDFSAYSDMAIGVAALVGYTFQRNFDQPYRARTLAEFWRRWHMSLSQWLRDYLYIPLGGNRGGRWKTYRNLMLTMVLGGLWHGASWKFVLWGFLHGAGLAVERLVGGKRGERLWGPRFVGIVVVFHFVCFCWVFFRAKDMTGVAEVLGGFARWSLPVELVAPLPLALIALGLVMHFTPRDLVFRVERLFQRLPMPARGLAAGIVIAVIDACGMDGAAPFIYFQF
jgi:D-alanyl-lipoteichoic acid acyltransferase DltB (MBOAT superfamily)